MKGVRLNIKGDWAQFRRPETNNNPLSHDFITKTAMIGMIGAVLGKTRTEMKVLFPVLSEDLKYGVQIKNEVKKQSWGFTFRSVNNVWEKAPKQMELIRSPNYEVIICLTENRSEVLFDEFVSFCKEGKSCYQPVLGLHNCPAEIQFLESGFIEFVPEGIFETYGFVTTKHIPAEGYSELMHRIGFDKIPSFQNHDFWNLPEKYISIIYPSDNNVVCVSGEHYIFNNSTKWCLI